jgi:acetyl-CoA carboxylase carboxyltransferase component
MRLGYKREMEAEADPDARQALFETLVAHRYAEGKAINVDSHLEIDAVIDPAETRGWIARGLSAAKPAAAGPARFIDTWQALRQMTGGGAPLHHCSVAIV